MCWGSALTDKSPDTCQLDMKLRIFHLHCMYIYFLQFTDSIKLSIPQPNTKRANQKPGLSSRFPLTTVQNIFDTHNHEEYNLQGGVHLVRKVLLRSSKRSIENPSWIGSHYNNNNNNNSINSSISTDYRADTITPKTQLNCQSTATETRALFCIPKYNTAWTNHTLCTSHLDPPFSGIVGTFSQCESQWSSQILG